MSKTGRDYLLIIEDILEAFGKIEKYAGTLTFEEFRENSLVMVCPRNSTCRIPFEVKW